MQQTSQQPAQQDLQQDATLQQRPRTEQNRLEENREPLSPAGAGAEIATKRPLKSFYDEEHEAWYRAFWNRQGKAQSRKAYEKAVNRAHDRDHLGYRAATLFLAKMVVDDKARFEGTQEWDWRANLHPATWLNQERWTDEAKGLPKKQMGFEEQVTADIQRRLANGEKPW